LRESVGKMFFDSQYLPNFGPRGLKFFCILTAVGAHFLSKLYDPNLNPGAWGDDQRNKKNLHFDEGYISNQVTEKSTKCR